MVIVAFRRSIRLRSMASPILAAPPRGNMVMMIATAVAVAAMVMMRLRVNGVPVAFAVAFARECGRSGLIMVAFAVVQVVADSSLV